MFEEMISRHLQNKDKYIKMCKPPNCGISIEIRNNKIARTIDGRGHFIHPERKRQFTRLITNVLKFTTVKDCFVNINLTDHPIEGCFNFTGLIGSEQQFLIPNHRFTEDDIQITKEPNSTKTFEEETKLIRSLEVPFAEKISKIYTSGQLQSAKLDYYVYSLNNTFCDGYAWVGSCHKNSNGSPDLVDKLKKKNMAGDDFEPFITHGKYKYVLYNDGNTLSDRMRLLLCLNSIIIRKKSPYEEFYTYKMKNNVNYVEYTNITEIKEIYEKLENDPEICKTIVNNNKQFVDEVLTYNNILQYTADIINGIC
jgi:hypothetical protein